jgi:3-oxoacyl-[acyl-carrier-protein] synthase II
MRKRVVITGMGCISPLGNDVQTTWQNIVHGQSGIGPVTHYDASDHKVKIAAEVKGFDAKELFGHRAARKMDRFTQFALAATQQAVKDAKLDIHDGNRDRMGVIIGSGIGGIGILYEQFKILHDSGPGRVSPFLIPMMLPDSAAGTIAIELGVRGSNMAVVTACATGTNAIGEATAMIRRGEADVVFSGGSEAAIVPISMAGLAVMNAMSTRNDDPERASRPFDKERDGFVMGEGAATLVLESLDHALARGATILAEVSGYGSTNDAYHATQPAENGEGAVNCMRVAISDASLTSTDIHYINAHGTSTPLNDKSETKAIKTVFGERAYDFPISSTKSMTGHLLGASGALEALFCVCALMKKVLPPTINYEYPDPDCDLDYVPNTARQIKHLEHVMSNSFGFGGHNATVILSRYEEENGK